MNISDRKLQTSIPGRRDRLVLRVGLSPAVVQLKHHERVALATLKKLSHADIATEVAFSTFQDLLKSQPELRSIFLRLAEEKDIIN